MGGAAAAGLSKAVRTSRNEPGGVVGLVYLVGVLAGEGETMLDTAGGAYPPFIKQGNVSLFPSLLPYLPTFPEDSESMPVLTDVNFCI